MNKKSIMLTTELLLMLILFASCGQRKTKAADERTPFAGVHQTSQEQEEAVMNEPPLDSQAIYETLIKAIQTDNHPAFDKLIKQVPDIDRMIPFPEPGYVDKDYSLLGFACKFKRCEMAEKIINRNADITIGEGDEYIINDALFVAVESKDVCIVRLLLNKGANPNQMNSEYGLTVLSVSCRDGGNYDIAKLLIENGAKVDGAGDTGFEYIIYPLLEAVQSNNIKLVQLLIDNNCTVDIEDKEGTTPFSIAESNNNPQMLELLQKHSNR